MIGAGAAGILVILTYLPFVFVLANSVKSASQYAHDPLGIVFSVRTANYIEAWAGMDRYLLNTVIVAAVACALAIPAAALSAYAFAEMDFRGKNAVFLAYIGLLMIPWTLTLIPLFLEIEAYHLYNTWWALILPYAAGSQPLMVFLFRTFFEGIPRELFDSGRVDGANEVKVLSKIVVPMSRPIFLTGAVILFINVWGDYLWPTIVLQNSHLQTASAGLEIFLSSFGYSQNGVGPEYAAYIITMAPIVLLVCLTMKYFVSGVTSGALKA